MKKIIFVLFILATVTGAFAGGSKDASGMPKIGVAIYKFDDTFMSTVRNAIANNAEGKAALDIVDSQNAQPVQNDQIESFFPKE